MNKYIFWTLMPIIFNANISADYIENSERYTLSPKINNFYMSLVNKAYEKKSFTKEELQTALASTDNHPLGDILRILAYDEIKDYEKIQPHLKYIGNDNSLLIKDKEIAFALVDVLLRIGEFEKISNMLPRNYIVSMSKDDKNKAYYYRGMSSYLKNKEQPFTNDFLIAKYRFKASREIFINYKKSLENKEDAQ